MIKLTRVINIQTPIKKYANSRKTAFLITDSFNQIYHCYSNKGIIFGDLSDEVNIFGIKKGNYRIKIKYLENLNKEVTYDLQTKFKDILFYLSIVLFIAVIALFISFVGSSGYYYYYYSPLTTSLIPYLIIGGIILIVAQVKPKNERKYLRELIMMNRKIDLDGRLLIEEKSSIAKKSVPQARFCTECGQEVDSKLKYCTLCGNRL
ncbi:MAG: zinc ribbon domain-containing protein [Candidatus Lokiarchaeota archaeon]|nr:zinc ribbon domain-containing protein [Candidatus Lokiarchaeota archaeon]